MQLAEEIEQTRQHSGECGECQGEELMHRRTEVGVCGVCDPGEPGRGRDTAC